MSEGLSILIFAAVAAVLFFKLRSVLGRRTGHEKRPFDSFRPAAGKAARRDDDGAKVVPLPERAARTESGDAAGAATLARSLRAIAAADPSFREDAFLEGARTAFGWIVEAFADGNREQLRQLVSKNVYDDFTSAIGTRERADESLETDLVRIKSADLLEAELQGRTAFVTVKFVSEQINVTRDRQGHVVDGVPGRIEDVTDIWTFARNTRSRDPNWTLVETRSPH